MTDRVDPLLRLPHRGPALLLDEVLARSDDAATCRVTIRADHPYLDGNFVPLAVCVELIAQAAAVQALSSFGSEGDDSNPDLARGPGMLVAVPELELSGTPLALGDVVEVTATRDADLGALVRFAGTAVRWKASAPRNTPGERVAQGTIVVKEGVR